MDPVLAFQEAHLSDRPHCPDRIQGALPEQKQCEAVLGRNVKGESGVGVVVVDMIVWALAGRLVFEPVPPLVGYTPLNGEDWRSGMVGRSQLGTAVPRMACRHGNSSSSGPAEKTKDVFDLREDRACLYSDGD